MTFAPPHKNLPKEDQMKLVENMQWFHAIDFGAFGSSGRHRKGSPQNASLYGTFEFMQALDLRGANILDLGVVNRVIKKNNLMK